MKNETKYYVAVECVATGVILMSIMTIAFSNDIPDWMIKVNGVLTGVFLVSFIFLMSSKFIQPKQWSNR